MFNGNRYRAAYGCPECGLAFGIFDSAGAVSTGDIHRPYVRLEPGRTPKIINYTTVTLVTLLSLMVLIFILNYAFAKGVLWLFKT